MEIRGEKEVDYINKLYFDFENQKLRERVQDKIEDRNYTKREIALLTLKEAKNEVLRSNQSYTKSEIAEFLDRSTATYAHEFLDKLIKHNVLKDAGKRKTGSSPVDIWKLDKGKLMDEYAESQYFQKRKDLDAAALDHIGEAFKFN